MAVFCLRLGFKLTCSNNRPPQPLCSKVRASKDHAQFSSPAGHLDVEATRLRGLFNNILNLDQTETIKVVFGTWGNGEVQCFNKWNDQDVVSMTTRVVFLYTSSPHTCHSLLPPPFHFLMTHCSVRFWFCGFLTLQFYTPCLVWCHIRGQTSYTDREVSPFQHVVVTRMIKAERWKSTI